MKTIEKNGSMLPLLMRYLAPLKGQVIVLAVLIFSKIALQLVNPQIMKSFIDMAQTGGPGYLLIRTALMFLGVGILQQLMAVASTYFAQQGGWKSTNALRKDLARHCLHLDMEFHSRHSPGEMIERVDGDVLKLATFFSQFALEVVGNGILLIGIIAFMISADIRAGIPMIAVTVIALVVLLRIRKFSSNLWERFRQAEAELFGYLEERLSGTTDIRALNAVSYVMRGFYGVARKVVRTLIRAGTLGAGSAHNSAHLLSHLGIAVTLGIGAMLFAQGKITIGVLYILYHYAGMTRRPVDNLAHQMRELQQASAGIRRVRSPQVIGLLGRTGSGKTTISRLLFRLYDVTSGHIVLDNDQDDSVIDIKTLPVADLRGAIGLVTQNIQLYTSTLRDNITVFDPSVPDERILEVLDALGLSARIAGFPKGIHTCICESGISAGEAQLVAFARVFLHDPGLVVLDEASSRLDPATESLIEKAVDQLLKGRTAIIIAHRLSTVLRSDSIMILREGSLDEFGDRQTLLDDPHSLFSRLLSKDSGGLLDKVPA